MLHGKSKNTLSLTPLAPSQKIVFFGCGSVGKCCVYYLKDFLSFDYKQITIIDKDKKAFRFPPVKEAISQGANALVYNIQRNTFERLLDEVLSLKKYDIVIDLSTNTSTYKIFKECRMRGLIYINTSIEDDKGLKYSNKCVADSSIFLQHVNLQNIVNKTYDTDNVTTVVEFGMNPGLISVFVKRGLMHMAKMVLKRKKDKDLLHHYRQGDHKKVAEILKVRAIHCSEIDTQIPRKMPKEDFVNTWSCVGLITEGVEPAEIQIGTHEDVLPFKKGTVSELIPQLLVTKTPGQEIHFKSIVPLKITKNGVQFTHITGRCIHHGEGISLNRYLGSFKYSPTMHYVYQLNPLTDKQLSTYSKKELVEISNDASRWKVLNMYDNDIRGYDNVGALFVLEENPISGSDKPYCFWTGSILDDKYTKNVLNDPYFGPTTIQVMAGVLSAVHWVLNDNMNKGLVFGEDIDDKYIMRLAKKYLGVFYSGPVTGGLTLDGTTLDTLIFKGGSRINNVKVRDL